MSAGCVAPIAVLRSLAGDPSLDLVCRMLLEDAVQPTQMGLGFYLVIFATTCFLEAPFYYWFTHKSLRLSKQIEMILVVNLATHPFVTWVFPLLFLKLQSSFGEYVIAAEIFAPVTEALLLRLVYKQSWQRASFTAFIANLFSWWIGPYLLA
jgi:hypothetical protein